MSEREKVTVDEVIGLIHTDKPTDSVEEVCKLRGRKNEKRFTIFGEWHKDCVIDEIRDNTGEYVTIGRVVDLLNENEQLKQNCKNYNWYKQYKTLLNENEQLKQYIYDNLDEDICDVCSYQYLEKSQMDKYYIAKCKKGYDNCSKGTVIHCKDFKFKELQKND